MAENVHFKYPNFCLGPRPETFCSINQDDATTILRIKNNSGGLLGDYSLSSNIVNELIHLEYVGPSGLTAEVDGLTFFTVERVSSTRCIIKRYEMRTSSNQLNLKSQVIKYTTGLYYYDIRAAAVEHYERTFGLHNPGGVNYLEIDPDASNLVGGERMFLGPSNDADNLGATESVIVTGVAGNTISVTPNLTYQYVIGDQISFHTDVYLISNLGAGGDTSRGTIFKIDPDSGAVIDSNTDKVYRNIDAARWSLPTETIASIAGDNMLFINPYSSYYNWKSIYLNNLEEDNATSATIYDAVFEDTSGIPTYLLATKKTTRDDDGNRTTEDWGSWYNYIENTLTPYTNSIQIYADENILIGDEETVTLNVKVIDQFGVSLSARTVYFYMSPAAIGSFDPLGAQVDTDPNGEASIDFTFNAAPTDIERRQVEITCKTDGSSVVSTGSAYVWNSIKVYEELRRFGGEDTGDDNHYLIYTMTSGINIESMMFAVLSGISAEGMMISKSFFTNPGGDWTVGGAGAGQVATYLPTLIVGPGEGPIYTFTTPDSFPDLEAFNPMPNTIHQVEEFDSILGLKQLPGSGTMSEGFKCLTEAVGGVFKYEEPYFIMQQIKDSYDLQLSQLKLSAHTYWVGTTAYDYLWADTTLDQFIFVEDAIPAFWSEKNPIATDIWIRLRPFAYSLDVTTLRYYVREVWFGGDTGYVDVSSQVTYQYFDAGGGILGVELTYDPIVDFHHNSVVYVLIELYDTAPSPNYISTNYWFTVTPDYKAPYLDNLSPAREESDVVVNPDIYFEIKDDGSGVDIDSLEMTINSRAATPTTIVKISDYHYQVTYTHHKNFYHDKRIIVGVKVDDLSDYDNWLNDRYAFYIVSSEGVFFTDFEPGMCKRGLSRFQDVSFIALGIGDGVDRDTLRLQIHGYDVTDESTIVPIIYRIS